MGAQFSQGENGGGNCEKYANERIAEVSAAVDRGAGIM